MPELKLFPDRASALAERVDSLTLFALAISAFFSLLIAGLIFYFGLKYRRRREDEVGRTLGRATTVLEVTWTIIPLGIVLFLFGWGMDVYFRSSSPRSGQKWTWYPGATRRSGSGRIRSAHSHFIVLSIAASSIHE
ncbi:MAG: hypothetical protein L6Q76_35835 [Polyangiaceae bacterium]|nr:hypothetical protein [Polyangiaceae bacterium]